VAAPAIAESVALPPEPPLTLERALDCVFRELSATDQPILPRLEEEMIKRSVIADDNDLAKAARRLGLTKVALQKKVK
jgi:ActR/RegA family two-component response regulator